MTPPTDDAVKAARERLERKAKDFGIKAAGLRARSRRNNAVGRDHHADQYRKVAAQEQAMADDLRTILSALAAAEKRAATLERELWPITMQDVRLAVGEGLLKPEHVFAGCNAELRRRLALTNASAGRTDGGA